MAGLAGLAQACDPVEDPGLAGRGSPPGRPAARTSRRERPVSGLASSGRIDRIGSDRVSGRAPRNGHFARPSAAVRAGICLFFGRLGLESNSPLVPPASLGPPQPPRSCFVRAMSPIRRCGSERGSQSRSEPLFRAVKRLEQRHCLSDFKCGTKCWTEFLNVNTTSLFAGIYIRKMEPATGIATE